MEHILLKSNGYCKIGCYDSCLNFVKTEKNRWDRVQNSKSYIAPEGNKIGATYSYDYWCLGISIFKMLTNKFPFQNKLSMLEDLVPEIEDKNVSIEAKNLVTNLLVKDPTERLGCKKADKKFKNDPFFNLVLFDDMKNYIVTHDSKNSERNIKEDEFFKEIDFVKLEKMEIKPPFLPYVVSNSN